MSIFDDEKNKYINIWSRDRSYAKASPMERDYLFLFENNFLDINKTVVDFGCGCGRADLALARNGYRVIMIDITENALDQEVKKACDTMNNLTFLPLNLLYAPFKTKILGDYFICVDVIEHLPEQYIDNVVRYIHSSTTDGGLMSVACFPDKRDCGNLHLTVKPASYWKSYFNNIWGNELTIDLNENKYTGILTK